MRIANHAKCGDVGIKSLQRIFPSLKLPKKFRCVFCIDGKIHKFGHGPCQEGRRTNYEPGVCLHTDHSGPYARSYGGARYSQLFLDRGSKYLWAFRMNKKNWPLRCCSPGVFGLSSIVRKASPNFSFRR